MTIDLHYMFPSPPCRAVMILARQIGLKLNLIDVHLFNGDQKTAEFERINPAKLIPVLNDNGFILAESRAILAYLVSKYSPNNKLCPLDPVKRAEIDRVNYLTAELFIRGKAIRKPVFYEGKWPIAAEAKQNYFELLKVLELLTKDRKFLAGDDMTIADISHICDMTILTDVLNMDLTTVAPGLCAWKERMKRALPEYNEFIGSANEKFKSMTEAKLGHELELN